MISLATRMENKYHGSFTLMDAVNDSLICENLGKFYVPTIETTGATFIKKDETIAVTNRGPVKICFLYLNAAGKNITNPDASYIQIPASGKGFLARLSISRNAYAAQNLELDYLIDIADIKYRVETEMTSGTDGNNAIMMNEVLKFENIELRDYPKVEFDRQIKEFILNKGQLFATYFR